MNNALSLIISAKKTLAENSILLIINGIAVVRNKVKIQEKPYKDFK